MVVIITLIGVVFSFTKPSSGSCRPQNRYGIYLCTYCRYRYADQSGIVSRWLLLIGLVWMSIHVAIIFIVARLIRAPFFFSGWLKCQYRRRHQRLLSPPLFIRHLRQLVCLGILGYAVDAVGGYISTQMMRLVVG